ncbi:hypothetical protein HYN59_11965 [Flavobacterium album]|uniref:Uncharacterized protein n=1 Tax=Flavobacterium album TaxID=2175091 RepID=A0A2S1QZT8_9FLAO|nr:hypothetical protein [Flavobacterium album]AWH85781.1 hypothetical protein HYN59_11965 [Flavobacterium album]
MGKKILREGYVIPQNGTKAFGMDRQDARFCYREKSKVYILDEADSLFLVADDAQRETLFYIQKKAVGTELDIPLDNADLNAPFREKQYGTENYISGENCGEAGEFTSDYLFNPDDYPDVEVNLITEKEFNKMKKTSVEYFEINNAITKKDSTITIAGKEFRDGKGDGGMPNTYIYAGEYKALHAYLLLYVCEACEEYTYFLIDKTTGEEIATFSNAPVFSANLDYVMDMGQLYSDSPTIIHAYKWKEKGSHGTYKEFGNWSPMGKGFWGSDNCFYTAVVPSITAESYRSDNARDIKKYNYRYIKIKIKADTPWTEEDGYTPPTTNGE